jgi:hypothetical protein
LAEYSLFGGLDDPVPPTSPTSLRQLLPGCSSISYLSTLLSHCSSNV